MYSNTMNKILLAGSTGYLGSFILEELLTKGFETRTVLRDEKKLPKSIAENSKLEIIKAELTEPTSIKNCCQDIDVVISTVGITKQKDGLAYMDVDYQANTNLLEDAKRNGVKKFIYISILNGDKLTRLEICKAKEKFVDALKNSGLDYCVIRPNGYFSDMDEIYKMAKKGKVYLFGSGTYKMNPIHVKSDDKEISIGGPQTLTHNQIAEIAFAAANRKIQIMHIPNWISKVVLFLLRTFTSTKVYGPIEFFMTVLSMDMIAPEYGTHTLKKHFEELEANKSLI